MRKRFLIYAVGLFFVNACTYQNAQSVRKGYEGEVGPPATLRGVQDPSLEQVPLETARRMVKHFKDKDAKRDFGGYAQFDPAELRELLSQPYVVDVKLVHAAFLDSEADDTKRNMATILICVKESAGATTYSYYRSTKICPPPDGVCSPER